MNTLKWEVSQCPCRAGFCRVLDSKLPKPEAQTLKLYETLNLKFPTPKLGARIKGTLGDIDPLSKVPSRRATSRAKKGPPYGVSLSIPGKNPNLGFQAFGRQTPP